MGETTLVLTTDRQPRYREAPRMLAPDRMSEAEVAVRFAQHLLGLPRAERTVDVAIDGAGVEVGGSIIFRLADFLEELGWKQVEQRGKNMWSGTYMRDGFQMKIHSRSGVGDVVGQVAGRRIIAECKKGPLVKRPGSPEYPLLTTAIGQALLTKSEVDDVLVAAVPDSPAFRRIAADWRLRPGVQRSGIRICLVGRQGSVTGLEDAFDPAP